jgi:diaminopimelate epimerase
MKNIEFYKYQGAGNDFVLIDNRNSNFPSDNSKLISALCDRRFGVGADGLILIEDCQDSDFEMVYFNADGNLGSMCGNGGRCAVKFAERLKIFKDSCKFNAADGIHLAKTNKDNNVSLKMSDVSLIEKREDYVLIDTGSPHYIRFENNISKMDVKKNGGSIRYSKDFPDGVNVNFLEILDSDYLKIRTYERGVEDETLACGTGATAAAIAYHSNGKTSKTKIKVEALGGMLTISFECPKENNYSNIWLDGPAKMVFKGSYNYGK